ncbi:MAG: hypothetical protein ACLFTA_03315 [Candidatus Nanohaloarchaea archaeon]
MKAQSAIEYLITYGWVLVVTAIVSGIAFQYTDFQGCNPQVEGFQGEDLKVEQVGLSSEDDVRLVFSNEDFEVINVKNVEISAGSNFFQGSSAKVSPQENTVYNLAETDGGGTCTQATINISYEYSNLSRDFNSQVELTFPGNIVRTLIKRLEAGGDSFDYLIVNSALEARNDSICIGGNCDNVTASEPAEASEKYINRSGDTMNGTLTLNEIQVNCIGRNCNGDTGSLNGFVTQENESTRSLDGVLNVSDLRPGSGLEISNPEE